MIASFGSYFTTKAKRKISSVSVKTEISKKDHTASHIQDHKRFLTQSVRLLKLSQEPKVHSPHGVR